MLSYVNKNEADSSQTTRNFNGNTMDRSGGGDYIDENDDPSSIKKIIYGQNTANNARSKNQQSRTISRKKDVNNLNFDMKQLQLNLPEDMRISKLLRRLCSEDDPSNCIDLCNKLSVVIMDPANASYIKKSFDILADSILSVIENGSLDCLGHVTDIFGMMGYVMKNDFPTYKSWIVKSYKCGKFLKKYMMNSLRKTIQMDCEALVLSDQASRLMELLKDFLEAAENADVFIAITDVLIEICSNYPKQFEPHFTDIVDIVVGWHLEPEQKPEIKIHCSKVLQSFKMLWRKNLKFTTNLLEQFIEDISACEEDFASPEHCFGSLVDAHNTVIKCLTPDELIGAFGLDKVKENFEIVMKICQIAIVMDPKESVTLPVNESVILYIDCRRAELEIDHKIIKKIIKTQMDNLDKMNKNQAKGLILTIVRYVDDFKSNLKDDFINDLLKNGSKLMELKFHQVRELKMGILKIYHTILATKTVSVLQEVYKIILDDLNESLQDFSTKSQCAINFSLLALAPLATANNSIIVMWALQPSILEVLVDNLKLCDIELWKTSPNLHFAIVKMTYMHCINNNNFISSSSLFKSINKFTSSSPTSEHLTIIMNFIQEMLSKPELKQNYQQLLIDWCKTLLTQATQLHEILTLDDTFNGIIRKLGEFSLIKMPIKCAECFEIVCSYDEGLADSSYSKIAEICCIQMCSTDQKVRETYTNLFAMLPLRISLRQVNHSTGLNEEHETKISYLQHWFMSYETDGALRSNYFKEYMEKIRFSKNVTNFAEESMKTFFMKSWAEGKRKGMDFGATGMQDMRILAHWMQWEAVRLCVNNKLRTPLGKPQETFLKIESMIKENARILALKERSAVKNVKTSIANQKNARILLGFLETLEKAIYNASEGTAFALLAPEKPAKTFFRVNSSTCAEWFNRIRTAVDLVALHCMEPEMVVRYTEAVLKELVHAGRTNEPIFEHTLMSLSWALLRNCEADSLNGLYEWCRKVSGKKILWIKMAAEQAAGHRETATNGYRKILDNCENLDTHIRDFVVDQLSICLYFSGRWKELKEFLITEESRPNPRSTIPIMSITSKQIDSMIQYEATKDPNVVNMADWEILNTGVDIGNEFSSHKMIGLVENSLRSVILNKNQNAEATMKLCKQVVQNYLQESLQTKSNEYLNQLTILNHICRKTTIKNVDEVNANDWKSLYVDKGNGSFTLMGLLSWSDYFDNDSNLNQQHINTRLDMVSLGRKENNFVLCKKVLEKYYRKSGMKDYLADTLTIECVQKLLMNQIYDTKLWNENNSRAVYEHCKLAYLQTDKKIDAINFAASATLAINYRIISDDNENLREREARFLLTLADWIQMENETIVSDGVNTPLNQLITVLPDIKPHPDLSKVDIAAGKLIQYSTTQAPDLPKAWAQLGTWTYRWGKKMVELKNEKNLDVNEIKKIIPNASSEDVEKIMQILNQHQGNYEEEDIGLNETSSTELMENLLTSVPILSNYTPECLCSIIEIWRQAYRSVYGYYEISAKAYFKYLQLCTKQNDFESDSSTVTATLRLLRLIVKHALGLKEVLEDGLASTPTHPWKFIIPQLFSRLNHHEPYVRKRVSELLCRVARDAPQLIIFPAVVGSDHEGKKDNLVENISLNVNNATTNSGLTICFNALLDIISKDATETVKQVQILVHELRRISLLWDELWVVTLQQVYSEYSKRFVNFENDLQKTKENGILNDKENLFVEKHKLLMRPLIFVLEQLYNMTSRPPETNHEKNFQEKFLKYIELTILKLKEPLDLAKPTEGWSRFKTLFMQIQQRTAKRATYCLKMSDISPILANMSDTAISMPGIESNAALPIHIKSVDNLVIILPTKTKPKKLIFYGSDGKRYTYLFKGLEDLHLDERIMQFLSIANLMMSKSIDCNGKVAYYKAQHYSVIPLGPRSGLINWVDDVVPIFSLYKKWQQRQNNNVRPSEMYYKKLTPLLQKHGLKSTDNRKDWPLAVMKQVLKELQSETPKDLLAKELWCHSKTASSWRQIIRNYSLSMAVMSVIGYVIGLGDRHLDNVLVKLTTGEIVHIDYNVCFEKGKTLRVPEKVPFRMTPNLEEALGVTGIEGTFRLACEHVLKSLKKGRETLLTLLEAFVYDPLVDWAVSDDGDSTGLAVSTYGGREGFNSEMQQAKKQLEREVNRDTLAIRFSEIKTDWIQNRNDVYHQILLMQNFLKELNDFRKDMSESERHRNLLSQQIQMIREAESLGSAIGSHPLNTLSQRYGVFKKIRDEQSALKKVLLSKASECDRKIEDYRSCKRDIEQMKLHEYMKDVDANVDEFVDSEFDLVKEFLENSAQGQQFLQCDQLRRDLNSLAIQEATVIKLVLDTLIQYGNIIQFYPKGYENHHRSFIYAGWCRKLADKETIQTCHDVMIEYQTHLNETKMKLSASNKQVLIFSYQLKQVIVDGQIKLNSLIAVQPNEIMDEQIYRNALSAIELFAQQEINAKSVLNCVALRIFSDLNQRFLMMENAASSARDNLVDLKLHDVWFLEELYMMANHANTLCYTLFGQNDGYTLDYFQIGMQSLKICTEMYETLHDMNQQFMKSIITDTVQGIISENKSVLEMISSISNLQQDFIPLPELLTNLNMHLQCTILGLPSPHTRSIKIVEELNEKISNLINYYKNGMEISLGKSLFCHLFAIFEKLDAKQKILLDLISNNASTISPQLDKLDQIKESKDLAVLILNRTTSRILESISMVKRLQALIEFFTLCLQLACAFKGAGMATVYDDDTLNRPIRKYIADYVYHFLLGVGPNSVALILCGLMHRADVDIVSEIEANDFGAQCKIVLDELCQKGIDTIIKKGEFPMMVLNHANSLCYNLNLSWKKMIRTEVLNWQISQLQMSLGRQQTLFIAHSWLHEDILNAAAPSSQNQPNELINFASRSTVLLQLQKYVETLTSFKLSIQKIKDEIFTNTNSIIQRLKWGAGANPDLHQLLSAFEVASLKKREFNDNLSLFAAISLKHCVSVLNYELERLQMPDDTDKGQNFQQLIQRWEKTCLNSQSCASIINPVEEALVELLDPEGQVDPIWLKNVSALIDDMTEICQAKIAKLEKEIGTSQDNLHMTAHKLRTLISFHHKIASDIRSLLKMKLKIESSPKLRDYLTKYKAFLEGITELHANVLSKDFTDELVMQAMAQIDVILPNVQKIFDDLFVFEKDEYEGEEVKEGMEVVAVANHNQGGDEQKTENVKQIQKEQKRNAYAVSVWRRIRMKLEGREPDANRRCTVQEQVDWMIREAMDADNLAVLYEGWTPWV